ncbi:hypothetical protein CR513_42128, partial [Mucuna pruriens]
MPHMFARISPAGEGSCDGTKPGRLVRISSSPRPFNKGVLDSTGVILGSMSCAGAKKVEWSRRLREEIRKTTSKIPAEQLSLAPWHNHHYIKRDYITLFRWPKQREKRMRSIGRAREDKCSTQPNNHL